MPCWMIQANIFPMDRMTGDRLGLLHKALESLGYQVYSTEESRRSYGCDLAADDFKTHTSITVDSSGKVTFVDSKKDRSTIEMLSIQNAVKRAFSGQVVKHVARVHRWNLGQSENKFEATRSF